MRKVKIVKIDGQEVTIKELRVRDIYELASADGDQPLLERMEDMLSRCSDISRESLMDMTPSEIEELWAAFKEVNASFLSLAHKAGLGSVVDEVREMFQRELSNNLQQRFAELSPPATVE